MRHRALPLLLIFVLGCAPLEPSTMPHEIWSLRGSEATPIATNDGTLHTLVYAGREDGKTYLWLLHPRADELEIAGVELHDPGGRTYRGKLRRGATEEAASLFGPAWTATFGPDTRAVVCEARFALPTPDPIDPLIKPEAWEMTLRYRGPEVDEKALRLELDRRLAIRYRQ